MIEVDIMVTALNKKYDFLLDENATVANIIEEVVEMVCQHERKTVEDAAGFELCFPEKKIIFDQQATLEDYSIENGALLLLV